MNKPIDISNVFLKTERLILRPWKPDDAADMYEYARVEGVGEMAGWLPHKTIDESKQIVEMFIENKNVFAVECEGKVIGSFGIEAYYENDYPELDDLQARELGYVLSKNYWGRGLMTEAVREVVRYLFEDECLDAITCCYFVGNNRSERIQEKCGFEYVRDSIHKTNYGETKEVRCNILTKDKYRGK